MNRTVVKQLSDVVNVASTLPESAQEAIAREIGERVADFSTTHMTEEQRAEVRCRLELPRAHVSNETVRAILRRYNPSL
jgi:hypothetical protein